ncbi:hypothetical protein ACHAW6_002426, partial [Cyclotella cf. meneghiniana]
LVSCLSAEWQYICQTVPDVSPSLAPVENALRTKFLPTVLGIDGPIDDKLRTLLGNGVKTRGLAIWDPTLAAASLYSTSIEATDMLTGTLIQNKPINVEAHWNCVHAAGAKHWKPDMMAKLPSTQPSWNVKKSDGTSAAGAWLSTIPDKVSGTKLTKDKWLDNVTIRYGWRLTNLPDQCDGCGAGLMLEHGLSCKRGGLVGIHHDDVRDEWAHLCSIALTDLRVVIKPTIFYGNGSRAGVNNANPTTPCTANPTNTLGDEAHGDVLAYGFWNRGRGTVFDVRICDTDSRSYGNTSSSKILECLAKEKRDK